MDKNFVLRVNQLEDESNLDWLIEEFQKTWKVSEQAYIAETVKYITDMTIWDVYAILDGRRPL